MRLIKIWEQFNYWTVLQEQERRVQPNWSKRRVFLCKCKCWINNDVTMDLLVSWNSKMCRACSWKIKGINRRWKLNSNWKWWIYPIQEQIRKSKEYKKWRQECFERDNYTCQISGQVWWKLVVHHLEPFHLIINDLNEDNYRENEILFDIGNGITITEKLHKEFHKKFWSKNFTKENFYEFQKSYLKVGE